MLLGPSAKISLNIKKNLNRKYRIIKKNIIKWQQNFY